MEASVSIRTSHHPFCWSTKEQVFCSHLRKNISVKPRLHQNWVTEATVNRAKESCGRSVRCLHGDETMRKHYLKWFIATSFWCYKSKVQIIVLKAIKRFQCFNSRCLKFESWFFLNTEWFWRVSIIFFYTMEGSDMF